MESRTHCTCSGQKMKPLTRFVTRASPKVRVGSQPMPVTIDQIKRIVACDLRKVSSDGVLHGIHRGWRLQHGNSTERRRRRDRWRIALSQARAAYGTLFSHPPHHESSRFSFMFCLHNIPARGARVFVDSMLPLVLCQATFFMQSVT